MFFLFALRILFDEEIKNCVRIFNFLYPLLLLKAALIKLSVDMRRAEGPSTNKND